MKANVTSDQVVRTIRIAIESGSVPDIDITRSWHRRPRLIRPILATLQVVNGEQKALTVTGGLVLKSGAASTEVQDVQEYRRTSVIHENIAQAPAWVRVLWDEAPAGLTSWIPQESS